MLLSGAPGTRLPLRFVLIQINLEFLLSQDHEISMIFLCLEAKLLQF